MSQPYRKPNSLITSTSPYLRQHAYNPVDWRPWSKETLAFAVKEDKPIIVSIGYSACHWCHVMERESFENEEIAALMNEHFICIKVDREERPDVDQIYMEAVQAMGLNGGWPLNVFTMPDQRPFYGGTYFPPSQWTYILKSIAEAYLTKRDQLEASSKGFERTLRLSDSDKYGLSADTSKPDLPMVQSAAQSITRHLDHEYGGLKRAPKFPNPCVWKFLLTANSSMEDHELHDLLVLTLDKMASGGIYDHLGGGFARYSVDKKWFAPHFEKMLYDNGQLISLYSMAYQVTRKERYQEVVYDTVTFLQRELMSPDYGFYSALDADSEGEEGNYYIWTAAEINDILGDNSQWFKKYYHVTSEGNWERGMNILHTASTPDSFAQVHNIDPLKFKENLQKSIQTLLLHRSNRERPGLDDKLLASWNAIALRGLIDAYQAFAESSFLDLALKNAAFIRDKLMINGRLLRLYSTGDEILPGFLEDYAFVVDAFTALYQTTFDEQWLRLADQLAQYTIDNFYDPVEELFFYTDKNSETLLARKKEIFDNVIPSSNSTMAINLHLIGLLTENEQFMELSSAMLSQMKPLILKESQYLANWAFLLFLKAIPTAEIAIVGKKCALLAQELMGHFIPNKVVAGTETMSEQPLLRHRHAVKEQTTIYVCYDKSCKLPVHSVAEALDQIV